MSANLDHAKAFIAACEAKDWAGMRAAMADDLYYHNIPMPPIRDADSSITLLKQFMGPAKTVQFIVYAIAEDAEGRVLTERLDKFEMPDGRWIELPVMGTMEFEAGKLKAWRDYFDLADFQRQMAGPG